MAVITAFSALLIARVNHIWSELVDRKQDCEKVWKDINCGFQAFSAFESELRKLGTKKGSESLYNNRYKPYVESIDELRRERTLVYVLFVVIVIGLPSLKAVADFFIAR